MTDHIKAAWEEARVPEGRSLDYKAELYDATPKGLREFAGDVAAFANTDGGLKESTIFARLSLMPPASAPRFAATSSTVDSN